MTKNNLKKQIAGFFRIPKSVSSARSHFYAFSIYGYCIAVLLHSAFAVLLVFLQMQDLALVSAGAAVIFALAAGCNTKGMIAAGFALAYLAETTHAGLAVYLSGNTGFHHYLIPLMALAVLFPQKNKIGGLVLGGMVSLEYIVLNHFAPIINPAATTYIQTGRVLCLVNVCISLFGLSLAAVYYGFATQKAKDAMEKDWEQSRTLLHNVLPAEIADQLKNNPGTITNGFDNATILFSDIVGFTAISQTMPPKKMVGFLNLIFSRFDDLAEKYGLEKIKTIGDAYMCTAGIPRRRQDHAEAAAFMAMDMMEEFSKISKDLDQTLRLRIGINSGAVVAGIIGKKKFSYDLWGDAVNTASRMASYGMPGEIQVSSATHELLMGSFIFEERGPIEIKGKGLMKTYLLRGSKP